MLLILLMVTAAAIPIVVPAMQNRQMREASRLVSSYLAQARSRAIETGRPVGVKLERFNGQPFAFTLSQVEVPPPYGGDTYNSKCAVAPVASFSMPTEAYLSAHYAGWVPERFAATMIDSYFNPRIVRVGDLIQFGGQGPLYTILGPDSTPAPDGIIDINTPQVLEVAYIHSGALPTPSFPWNRPTVGLPPPQLASYQVFRQPARSSTEPLQLPEGIVIDLGCSGMGTGGVFFDPNVSYGGSGAMTGSTPPVGPIVTFDPVIVFSPSGRLESVSNVGDAGQLVRPTDAVYLLVGRRELMFDATSRNMASDVVAQNLSPIPPTTAVLADPTTWPPPPAHFWVSVGYQTGLVTVSEVAATDGEIPPTPNFQDYQASKAMQAVITDALGPARHFARLSQSAGGR